jgi:hypothetical protein
LDLVIEFEKPVSVLEARRMARTLMESMEVKTSSPDFAGATLRSPEFRQIIKITPNGPHSEP